MLEEKWKKKIEKKKKKFISNVQFVFVMYLRQNRWWPPQRETLTCCYLYIHIHIRVSNVCAIYLSYFRTNVIACRGVKNALILPASPTISILLLWPCNQPPIPFHHRRRIPVFYIFFSPFFFKSRNQNREKASFTQLTYSKTQKF